MAAAQPLLTIIEDFHLQLLTVPGTPTHRWSGGESTIDLTFASEDVASPYDLLQGGYELRLRL